MAGNILTQTVHDWPLKIKWSRFRQRRGSDAVEDSADEIGHGSFVVGGGFMAHAVGDDAAYCHGTVSHE